MILGAFKQGYVGKSGGFSGLRCSEQRLGSGSGFRFRVEGLGFRVEGVSAKASSP